ncbi:nuclear transport factor 2 family protein [Streptomyces sp. NPDC050546]|uniref:nuclear transport factor 2 family protein n=1 Tax=Streptomyces sp. NPDC050546 TaxID=3365628 RepID=UPI00379FF63D
MSTQTAIPEGDLVQIVQEYYDSVDSRDAARVANNYLVAPNTTLQFNADDPIVTVEAIKEFSAQLFHIASVRHSMIDIWTTPLMGDVVPVNLAPARSASTVTVVSTALPTFSVDTGSEVKHVAIPATSIFTIDIESEKFVSVHNMFDLAKVYAAVGG